MEILEGGVRDVPQGGQGPVPVCSRCGTLRIYYMYYIIFSLYTRTSHSEAHIINVICTQKHKIVHAYK